jgi:hypothetical protein
MKNIKEKFEALKNKMELYDLFQHDDEVGQALFDLEKEIRCPKYVYNIAFGKKLCFALWEDDYAECAKIINAGDGKIVGYNRFEDGIEEVLENAVGAEDYQFVKEAQLEQINLLLKNK